MPFPNYPLNAADEFIFPPQVRLPGERHQPSQIHSKAVLLTCPCLVLLLGASTMPALDPPSAGNHSLTTDGINNHFPKQIKRQNPLQPFPLGAIPTFQMPHAKQVLPSVCKLLLQPGICSLPTMSCGAWLVPASCLLTPLTFMELQW